MTDDRLSREKAALLTRIINSMRHYAEITLISGACTEAELLKKLETKSFHLVIVPWYRYLAWSRVEAFYGLTRTSGPTFAGYFCEQLQPYELGAQADHLRAILLDFNTLSPSEIHLAIKALIVPERRSGIRPLLDANAPIYCENWYTGQGLGNKMDTLNAIPEIANTEWVRRAGALRIAISALWSLVYEEGPGKSEFNQAISAKSPKAYFQVGADKTCLAMRLCYSMPSWSPKDALAMFWPDPKRPAHPAQLLLRYADFLRVHTISEAGDLEVVACFFNSAPSEKAFGQIHTAWVEPIAANLVTEVPYEAPNPNSPHLRPFPTVAPIESKPRPEGDGKAGKHQDRFIFEAAVKIRELKQLLTERDDLIRDLRAGGVGTAQPLAPPDAEALLEAFQERYFEARFQIRQFELQIADMERQGATPQEVEQLRQKMTALANREQSWIKRIATTLEAYREAKKG